MPPYGRAVSNLTRTAPFIAAAWFTVIVPASQCHAASKIGVFTINISGLDPSFGDVAIDAIATAVTEVVASKFACAGSRRVVVSG